MTFDALKRENFYFLLIAYYCDLLRAKFIFFDDN